MVDLRDSSETKRNIIKPTVPLKEVFSQKGELKLLPGEWTAQNLNVIVNEPLTIRGSAKEKTLLHTDDLSINAKGRLILEDLTFKALTDKGEVRVKRGEVLFKNVNFSGVKLSIEGGKAITEDCLFENLNPVAIEISEKGAYESRGNIDFYNVPPNSQIRIMGIDIQWEKDITLLLLGKGADLKTVMEKISDKMLIILSLKPGTYDLDSYTIKNKKLTLKGVEGVNILGLIIIEDSEVTFENIQFKKLLAKESKVVFNNCKGKGISGKASQITIYGSEIYRNERYGINVEENSTLKIENSRVYENKRSGISGKASQIMIYGSEIHGNESGGIYVEENSTLKIENSKVYKNKWSGVLGAASQIAIHSSEIYGNERFGIAVEDNSTLKIENSRVYKNIIGVVLRKASQITIYGSEIYGNWLDGIYIDDSASKVEIENVKTWGNKWGLQHPYGTSVLTKNCDFRDGRKQF